MFDSFILFNFSTYGSSEGWKHIYVLSFSGIDNFHQNVSDAPIPPQVIIKAPVH